MFCSLWLQGLVKALLVFYLPPNSSKLLESPTGTEYTVSSKAYPIDYDSQRLPAKPWKTRGENISPTLPQNMTLYFIFDKLDMAEYTSWFRLHLMSHNQDSMRSQLNAVFKRR